MIIIHKLLFCFFHITVKNALFAEEILGCSENNSRGVMYKEHSVFLIKL
jgi:hypothetical protein